MTHGLNILESDTRLLAAAEDNPGQRRVGVATADLCDPPAARAIRGYI